MIRGQFCAGPGATIDCRRRPPDYLTRRYSDADQRSTSARRARAQDEGRLCAAAMELASSRGEARATQDGIGLGSIANASPTVNMALSERPDSVTRFAWVCAACYWPWPGLTTGGRLFRNSACCRAASRCCSSSRVCCSGLGPGVPQADKKTTTAHARNRNVTILFITNNESYHSHAKQSGNRPTILMRPRLWGRVSFSFAVAVFFRCQPQTILLEDF